ncbi:aspartic peptidase domain-containing protein [Tricladium varicosporioides]|nr:aspartic peptidase domain-containing protein [Hymenoscyphus varicosporioides]
MILVKNFVAVVALASAARAFFPWVPEYHCALDDTCVSSKRSVGTETSEPDLTLKLVQRLPSNDLPRDVQIKRLAHRLRRKYESRRSPEIPVEVPERRGLAARAGAFPTVTAATPTQTNSAGIDQDGTDFSYFTQVLVGSANTPMSLLLDTGAGTSWVMGSTCTSDPCKTHATYTTTNSKTVKDLGMTFSINYGSGNVSGTVVQDTFSIAGLKITTSIGIAIHTSDDFSHFPIDGILGLSLATSSYPHFWESLVASKALKANMFGISLNRNADGPNNGVINFGAPDTSRYTGNINYYPVAPNSPGDWALTIANVGTGTTQAGVSGRTAYIDTGTSFIFGPPADVKKFHATLKGASSPDGITYTVPCTTTDSATITFGSETYTISPKDWVSPAVNGVCTSNIYGVGVVDDSSWLVGDTFLKNVYAVFDYDKTRVGFAQRSTSTSTTSALATSTGSLSSTIKPQSTLSATSATALVTGSTSLGAQSNTATTGSSTATVNGAANNLSISTATKSSGSTSTGIPGFVNGHETSTTPNPAAQTASGSATPAPTKSLATKFNNSFLTALAPSLLLVLLLS